MRQGWVVIAYLVKAGIYRAVGTRVCSHTDFYGSSSLIPASHAAIQCLSATDLALFIIAGRDGAAFLQPRRAAFYKRAASIDTVGTRVWCRAATFLNLQFRS